ncbi:MAG: amidase family protein [Pseudohongiellaceae bacterium]
MILPNRIALVSLIRTVAILSAISLPVQAADNGISGYDQGADLAIVASHESESMQFELLHSRVSEKPDLWINFEKELADFGEAGYQRLKPLVLDKPITELQDSVLAEKLSYQDLVTFYLYRIREIEQDGDRFLNAIIATNPNALQDAKNRDEQRQAGRTVSQESLFGIPVLLKDNIGYAGLPTTAGAVALTDNVTANAFIAQRLEDSGAVILGKANLSEWAYFFCDSCPSGYSALGGQTLNPYGRLEFGTGGSSSGSGAAAAANLAAVTVGSETSGSILSPASANSLVGLKPTTGSLSRSGIVPISATLDTAGPITKSVADAVLLFNAMSGFDPLDTAMPMLSQDNRLVFTDKSLRGQRIGVLDSFEDNVHYQAAIKRLADAGAIAVPIVFESPSFSGFDKFLGGEMVRDLSLYLEAYGNESVQVGSVAEVQSFNEQELDIRAPYGQALIDMMAGLEMTGEELEALRIRLQDSASGYLEGLFAEFDLDVLASVNNRNAGLAALANYPALTIPMGYQDNGRPLGLTFFAPSYQEQMLIDVGLQYEKLSLARKSPAGYE